MICRSSGVVYICLGALVEDAADPADVLRHLLPADRADLLGVCHSLILLFRLTRNGKPSVQGLEKSEVTVFLRVLFFPDLLHYLEGRRVKLDQSDQLVTSCIAGKSLTDLLSEVRPDPNAPVLVALEVPAVELLNSILSSATALIPRRTSSRIPGAASHISCSREVPGEVLDPSTRGAFLLEALRGAG